MDLKFLLEQVASVTIIFAITAIATSALRRHSAAARHMIWWLSFFAALILPVVSYWKPTGAPAITVASMTVTSILVTPDGALPDHSWTLRDGLLTAWVVGFALTCTRLLVGLLRSSGRRRASRASYISVDRRNVQVRLSDRIAIPETFGIIRPVILLPPEAIDWSEDRLHVVLAHELVHVERRDWLTQLLAQFGAAVYWFHPFAWMALSQLRRECELACDDGVLQLGFRNSEYARHLLDVARSIRSNPEALAPAVPMAGASQLEARIRAILSPVKNRGKVTMMMKLATTACAAVVIFLFSSANGTAAGTATVSGIITDPSGARVPRAQVLLTTKGKAPMVTTASESGEWAFREVMEGEHGIEVRMPGFRLGQRLINVIPGQPQQVVVPLDLGSLQETIQVKGQGVQAQPATGTPTRIRVGGNVQAAKVITLVRPTYPEHLKAIGVSGNVVLQAVISREGDVLNLEVLSPDVHPDLVTTAKDAVMQWKYEPTRLNGEAVEVVTMINVNFTLAP